MAYKLIGVVLALALVATAATAAKVEPLKVKDIKKLIETGVEEELIITQSVASGLAFPLDDKNVFELMKAGASEGLLIKLIKQHGSKFQTTPDNIIKLKEKGASTEFISFLQNPAGYTIGGTEKTGDLQININGSWSAKSSSSLNVYFAVFVDGERRTKLSQWSEVAVISASGTETMTHKLEPGTISVANLAEGTHNVEIVMWSGTGGAGERYPTDVIWRGSVQIAEGQRAYLNLEASGTDSKYYLR